MRLIYFILFLIFLFLSFSYGAPPINGPVSSPSIVRMSDGTNYISSTVSGTYRAQDVYDIYSPVLNYSLGAINTNITQSTSAIVAAINNSTDASGTAILQAIANSVSGTNARLDTANTNLLLINTNISSNTASTSAAIGAQTTSLNSSLSTINTNNVSGFINTILAINNQTTATVSGNILLTNISNSVSGTNARLDTANTHLSVGNLNAVSGITILNNSLFSLTGSVSANTVVNQSINASVSATNAKLDTANTHLSVGNLNAVSASVLNQASQASINSSIQSSTTLVTASLSATTAAVVSGNATLSLIQTQTDQLENTASATNVLAQSIANTSNSTATNTASIDAKITAASISNTAVVTSATASLISNMNSGANKVQTYGFNTSGVSEAIPVTGIDFNNTTSATINAGATYTGSCTIIDRLSDYSIAVSSPVASAVDGLRITQYFDTACTSSEVLDTDMYSVIAGNGQNFTDKLYGRSYRVTYTTVASATTFRLLTKIHDHAPKDSSHRIGDQISYQQDAKLVKATPIGFSLTADPPTSATVNMSVSTVLASDADTKGMSFVNASGTIISLGFSGNNAVLRAGVTLYPGGTYNMEPLDAALSGTVTAISSASGGVLSIQRYR